MNYDFRGYLQQYHHALLPYNTSKHNTKIQPFSLPPLKIIHITNNKEAQMSICCTTMFLSINVLKDPRGYPVLIMLNPIIH